MKTVTDLTGKNIEDAFEEPVHHPHTIGQTFQVPAGANKKGIFHRHIRLSPTGLVFEVKGEVTLGIRIEELWKLAEQAEPALKVPTFIAVPEAAGK